MHTTKSPELNMNQASGEKVTEPFSGRFRLFAGYWRWNNEVVQEVGVCAGEIK